MSVQSPFGFGALPISSTPLWMTPISSSGTPESPSSFVTPKVPLPTFTFPSPFEPDPAPSDDPSCPPNFPEDPLEITEPEDVPLKDLEQEQEEPQLDEQNEEKEQEEQEEQETETAPVPLSEDVEETIRDWREGMASSAPFRSPSYRAPVQLMGEYRPIHNVDQEKEKWIEMLLSDSVERSLYSEQLLAENNRQLDLIERITCENIQQQTEIMDLQRQKQLLEDQISDLHWKLRWQSPRPSSPSHSSSSSPRSSSSTSVALPKTHSILQPSSSSSSSSSTSSSTGLNVRSQQPTSMMDLVNRIHKLHGSDAVLLPSQLVAESVVNREFKPMLRKQSQLSSSTSSSSETEGPEKTHDRSKDDRETVLQDSEAPPSSTLFSLHEKLSERLSASPSREANTLSDHGDSSDHRSTSRSSVDEGVGTSSFRRAGSQSDRLVESLYRDRELLQTQLQHLKSDHHRLQLELQMLRSSSDSKGLSSSSSLSSSSRNNSAREAEKESDKERIRALEEQLKTAQREKDEMHKQNVRMHRSVETLTKRMAECQLSTSAPAIIDQKQKMIDALIQQKMDLQQQNARLQSQLHDMQDALLINQGLTAPAFLPSSLPSSPSSPSLSPSLFTFKSE